VIKTLNGGFEIVKENEISTTHHGCVTQSGQLQKKNTPGSLFPHYA
jgi:hypothetical protein